MKTEKKYDNLEIISVNTQPVISQFFNFTNDIFIFIFVKLYVIVRLWFFVFKF